MWRVTIKGLLAHKLRLALTGLAIVLGVTFTTGTLVLTDTLHNTFTSLFNQIYQNIDYEVRGHVIFSSTGTVPVRNPFPASVLEAVRRVPGVQVADGYVNGYAQFIQKNGNAVSTTGAPTIGMSYFHDQQLSSLHLVSGAAPTTGTQVVMDEGTARKYHFRVGDRVGVLLPGIPQTFTISGIVRFGTADNLAGATIAAFNLPTAQELFLKFGQYDTIEVITKPGADKAAVGRAIARLLPQGLEVVNGQTVANESASTINQALGFFSTALLVFGFIALFVGGFTIFNTFSIIVGQRTRELALLRMVGASRRQVFRSVLLEALLLGVVASLVGLGLGFLTAMGLVALLKAFGITLPTGSLIFKSGTVGAALLVGIGVTVVSAISPARRAVRIPAIAAVSDHQSVSEVSSTRRVTTASVVGAAGIVALLVGLTAPKIQLVGLGAVGIFVGVGMLSSLVARPISSVIGRPFARVFKISGRLGRENSMRSPRRTAQTSAALMVGLALVSTFAIFGASLSKSATSGINNAIKADYVVTNGTTGGPPVGFNPGASVSVASVPGVSRVSNVYSGLFEVAKSVTALTAIAPSDLSTTVILRMSSGAGGASLANGSILVDTSRANADHLHVGSILHVTFASTGPTTMRVGGIYKPNTLIGSYVTGSSFFRSHFAAGTVPIAMLIKTSTGATASITRAVMSVLKVYPNLKVKTRAQFIQTQQAQVNQLLGLVYALLALAILIALIGIVNTLMLSVFERTREIGLLRAVGMRRRQVRTMIRSEAVILSVFGAIIGIVVGTVLGVALTESLRQQGLVDLVIPFANLVFFLLLAAMLGLVAATWPARRAAKLNVLDAIATE